MNASQTLCRWQCNLCSSCTEKLQTEPPGQCPRCGCLLFQRVNKDMPLDHVNPEAVAHLTKKVENCLMYDQDETGKHYHPLKLVREIDRSKAKMDPKIAVVTIREVCETCGQLYTQRGIPVSRTDLLAKEGITL